MKIKIGLLVLLIFHLSLVFAQYSPSMSMQDILKEIERLTYETNWRNEQAAQSASKRIETLTGMLTHAKPEAESDTSEEASDAEEDFDLPLIDVEQLINSALNQPSMEGSSEMLARKKEMLQIMYQAGLSGEDFPDVDLAKPVREAIIEEYREEEKELSHPGSFNELEILVIDFSDPKTLALIPNLSTYSQVKTLMITGGKNFSPPHSLPTIFANCAEMKLQALYLINFKSHLSQLPQLKLDVSSLSYLGVFNNALESVPFEVFNLQALKTLHLDMNPIETLPPEISRLSNLSELGLVGTKLTPDEIKQIQNRMPNCKIQVK
jgi:Leucine-rich repeat (LRR) protein